MKEKEVTQRSPRGELDASIHSGIFLPCSTLHLWQFTWIGVKIKGLHPHINIPTSFVHISQSFLLLLLLLLESLFIIYGKIKCMVCKTVVPCYSSSSVHIVCSAPLLTSMSLQYNDCGRTPSDRYREHVTLHISFPKKDLCFKSRALWVWVTLNTKESTFFSWLF